PLPALVDREIVDLAAEERQSHRLVAVHEPWDRVRQVEVIGHLPELSGRADDLAAAQEVARLERKLAEESVESRITGAKLDLVARGLGSFDQDIDLLFLPAHVERRFLRH